MAEQAIARTLANFICGLSYDRLPGEVTETARNLILDLIGAAIAGRDLKFSHVAVKLARGSKGPASLITYGSGVSAPEAAFANSVLACGIAQDDVMFSFHPGVVNIPTALAIAEEQGSSGTEIITAVVAGYDVMGRIYEGAPGIRPAFRDASVFGPIAAAAVAGKLFKLNEEQLAHALSLAANMSSGLREWALGGAKERDFFDPLSAKNGIMAATLAREGVDAAAYTLEGKKGFYQAFAGTTERTELVTRDLGKRFLVMDARYKPYPACWLLQTPMELAVRLKALHQIKPEDISEVIAKLSIADATHPGNDFEGPFRTMTQAVLSTQFGAAAAFLGKPVTSYKFYFDCFDDEEVNAFAHRVRVVGEQDRVIPNITVKLNNGKELSLEQDFASELIPTEEKVVAKFNLLALPIIGKARADEIIDTALRLPKIGIREMVGTLVQGIN